jgi:hypothetical protein
MKVLEGVGHGVDLPGEGTDARKPVQGTTGLLMDMSLERGNCDTAFRKKMHCGGRKIIN